MNKIRENLLKAIEDRTNAYKQLSIKDIWYLSEAVKNIQLVSLNSEISRTNIPKVNTALYGCDDDLAIGFCD